MVKAGFRILVIVAVAAAALAVPVAQDASRHLLWTVRGEGPTPAYLLGSLHALAPEFYPLPPRIEEAFAASGTLIEEIDLAEAEAPGTVVAAMGRALLPEGQTLEDVLGRDLYARVAAEAEAGGVPRVALSRMKPWMVALALTAPALRRAGFDPAHGVDRHFFNRARALGMAVEGLETVAFQIERFDTLPLSLQARMLATTLDDLETQMAEVRVIAEAWARGDGDTLERLLLSAFREAPELYDRLLVERNRNWVSAVEGCLSRPRPCFIVVGAAHLVGPDSLVAMLREQGYTVVQQ
jgi:uncharacterized protein YbaP (TraB family)